MPLRAKHVAAALTALNRGLAEQATTDEKLAALSEACGELLVDLSPNDEDYGTVLTAYWDARDAVAAADEDSDEAILSFRESLLDFGVQLGFDGF